MSGIEWSGEGLPPVGAVCMIYAHNTLWGMQSTSGCEREILAYHGEFVWLGIHGAPLETTRIDKVDFKPIRTPEQIAADERIAAAQEWLKGIEREYGVEAADQCEAVLHAAESLRSAPIQLSAEEEQEQAVDAMWTVLNAQLPESARVFSGEYRAALRAVLATLHRAGLRLPQGGDA